MSNKDAIVKSLKSAMIPMIIFLIVIFIIHGKKAFENLEWFYIIGITAFNYFYTLYEIKNKEKLIMDNKIAYEKIYPADYEILTRIMTSAFNEDTSIHTDLKEDGPTGYSDGSLIKKLNEHKGFKNYKILFQNNIVGAYTIGIKENNEYTLELLFINPDYRKDHLGTMVWNDIEEKYKDAKKWTVETPDYSKRNHHFYTKKCGFTFCRENICANGSKSFVFEKEK